MPDREKVIKGLEIMLEESKYNDSVQYNPYADTETLEAAIALLKAQEPRVMADTELEAIRKAPLVLKPNVDAVPVEWMREKMRGYASSLKSTETAALVIVMQMWQKEQEAQDVGTQATHD